MNASDMSFRSHDRCLGCPARAEGLCGALDPATMGRLAVLRREQDVAAGRQIMGDDRPTPYLAILRKGYVRLQRHGPDGRRRIIGLTIPGEVLGARPLIRSGYSLEAATDVELCTFDRRAFNLIAQESPDLQRALLHQRMGEVDRLRWLTWALGALRPEERIAALYGMAIGVMPTQPQPDGSAIITVELSRADIADLLATTPETISRVTHRLAAEGEIELLGPRHVRIRNPAALARRGCHSDGFNFFAAARKLHASLPHRVPEGKIPAVPRPALTSVMVEGEAVR